MFAYGIAADALDEYLQLSEESLHKSIKEFMKLIVENFEDEYILEPTKEDLRRILQIKTVRLFPNFIGCINFQHWQWHNCPIL